MRHHRRPGQGPRSQSRSPDLPFPRSWACGVAGVTREPGRAGAPDGHPSRVVSAGAADVLDGGVVPGEVQGLVAAVAPADQVRRTAVGTPYLGDLARSHRLAGVMTLDDDAVSDSGEHERLLLGCAASVPSS